MDSNTDKALQAKRFEDILSIPLRNGIYKKKEFHGRGAKIVNMGELFAHPRITSKVEMKRVELTDKELKKSTIDAGDLIFARRSLTAAGAGKCSIILSADEPTTFESSIIRARLNKNVANPEFYYYLFNSPMGKHLLGTILRQVAVSGITGSDLAKLMVPVPPINYQNHVVSIVRPIDDKIQLNHQIKQTLEQMAQAIFQSWFVDFEPVKAKIAALEADGSEKDALLAAMQVISGKGAVELNRLQAEQPEQYAELRATAELFPSAMQDSGLGEIPEGWGNGTLGDIAELTSERISTEELSLETYISTENMLENRKGICSASSLPSSASVPGFEPGEILISNIRPYFKKIWLANMSGGRSPDVLGLKNKHKRTSEFLFNFLYQDQFFDYMMLTSKGAKMPRGDKKAIMQFACAVPPVELMQCFSERVRSFYTLATSNNLESKLLASTRDALLPKLLSGELSVSDAESQIAEVEEPANV